MTEPISGQGSKDSENPPDTPDLLDTPFAIEMPDAARQAGEKLKAAREEKGFALEEIARRMHLSKYQIEALETGNLAALPERTFVRGFIRNYAALVNLDAVPLLALLDQSMGFAASPLELPRPVKKTIIPASHSQIKAVFFGKNALVGIITLTLVLLVIFMGLFLPANFSLPQEHDLPLPQNVSQRAAPAVQATQNMQDTPAPAPSFSPPPVDPGSSVAPPPPSEPVTQPAAIAPENSFALDFQFEEASWVEVKDKNGKVLLSSLTSPGTQRLVTGIPPFSVVVGNAAHVRLSYKGKPVVLTPSAESGVARLTVP